MMMANGKQFFSVVFLFFAILTFFSTPAKAQQDTLVGQTFDTTEEGVELQLRVPSYQLLSGDQDKGKTSKPNRPGMGYDAQVNWHKASPTGFGRYQSISIAGVGKNASFDPLEGGQKKVFKDGGTILTVAGGGGRGGMWKRNTNSNKGWEPVVDNLPSPYHHAAAAIDPTNPDRMLVVAPSDKDKRRLRMYKTEDEGKSWVQIFYFEQDKQVINDRQGKARVAAKSAEMHYFENGENIFLYNFNGSSWGYYSTNGGTGWRKSDLNVNPDGSTDSRNRVYFTEDGHGLLNPTNGQLFYSTDYGKNWKKIKDYSNDVESLSFAISEDKHKIFVLYKKKNSSCCHLDISTDEGSNFTTKDLTKPFPKRGPQGLLVDPDEPSKLTAFIYMKGPYTSNDGGKNWGPVYNSSKNFWQRLSQGKLNVMVGHTQYYDTHVIEKTGTEQTMARPVDFRDVMVMDEYKNNPILIGSDQGLFVMSGPYFEDTGPWKARPDVSMVMWNVGAGMDNGEVYDVEVDDCGNLYHGLWHHTAMIRGKDRDNIYYYGDVPESHGMILKEKAECLGWASRGAGKGGPHDFKTYVTKESGKIKKNNTGITFPFKGNTPVFYEGMWRYIERENKNLYSVELKRFWRVNNTKSALLQNARGALKKDRATNSLWAVSGQTLYRFEPSQNQSGDNTNLSKSSSLSLVGSKLQNYDVHNNRVAALVKQDNKQDILIYKHVDDHTYYDFDFSIDNLFDEFNKPKIKDVWVDPTDPQRYFASVFDNSDKGAPCPFHLMATEDSGENWELFSDQLNCSQVYDLAFNPKKGKMYAATHARGVLEGNLNKLTDLGVSLSCADDEISESGMINCNLDFMVDGEEKKSWENAVEINIDLPFEDYLYELRTDNRTISNAGCFTSSGTSKHGFNKVKKIKCRSVLNNFPEEGLPIKLKMDRIQSDLGCINNDKKGCKPEIKAELIVNRPPQDLALYNDVDYTDFSVHKKGYKKDEYDAHFSKEQDKVISNNKITDPAVLEGGSLESTIWTHDRHLACKGEENQDCSEIFLDDSQDAPKIAKEVWTAEISPLTLWSSRDKDYYKIPLPDYDSAPMEALKNSECGVSTVQLTTHSEDREDSQNRSEEDDPTGEYATNQLFTLEASTYKTYFTNAKPEGYTLREVHEDLASAFQNEGTKLSDRARIKTPNGVQWENAQQWRVIDQGETFFVRPDGNKLNVYSAKPKPPSNTVEKRVQTKGWLEITLKPSNNDLAPTAVNPVLLSSSTYRNADRESLLARGQMTSDDEAVTMRISCPKGNKDLSNVILSVGEKELTAGGYSLNLEYHVEIRRGGDIMQAMDGNYEPQHAKGDESQVESSGKSESNVLTFVPKGGFSLPGVSNFSDVTGSVNSTLEGKKSVFTWGGSLSFGSRSSLDFRLSGIYRSGTIAQTLQNDQITTTTVNEKFTAFSADLVLRPLPRILVKPYLVGGYGFRKVSYGNQEFTTSDNSWKSTVPLGVGVDLPLGDGGTFLGIEVVDYLSNFSGEGDIRHDAVMTGYIGIPLF